ncbi:MFS transporter [Pusillimonas caeni]|uniref:MFS transporter n=1 Tax=Pusillimonas caeni TaxID=1348472 RepID=UPI000E5996D8|nr:MFS transporter [Pusillimonas caeni]TFL15577.1 MFS transporter [Pusillimonas caeni]
MSRAESSASWSELLSGRNALRSIALAGGVALHAVNLYIVATILPSVVGDIGGLSYYAWNITLFVAASIFSSSLSPKAMQALGPRRAFLTAIGFFALGTTLCMLALAMGWMLIGRTLQGIGGGLLLGLSYSSIRIVFAERLWAKAMALVSSMWGVAALSGPAIGGVFAYAGHWRWAFGAVLTVALLLAGLVQTQIASRSESIPINGDARIPLSQISLLVLSVLAVAMASLAAHLGWSVLGVVVALAIGIVVARLDARGHARLMPHGAYELKRLGSIYLCVAFLNIGITVEVFIPYFLQVLHGHSPLAAGYLGALMSAGWTIGAITSTSRTSRTADVYVRIGPIISALSLASLGLMLPWEPLQDALLRWVVVVPLVGVGLGIGMCWPHLLTHVFKVAPAGQENMASSAIITIQLYAMALGAAVGGAIINAAGFTDPGGVQGTAQAALALLLIVALAPGLAAYFVIQVVRGRRSLRG